MCGIVGVFSRRGDEVEASLVTGMRDAMTHRGPDDCGLWARPGRHDVLLGHRRLSIVDLSEAGRQPMSNEDGSVQVTFNGEIYNHEALRVELERRGHSFRSRCDAEVLVHLYEEHGPEMVDQLVGMFAFAIWDEARQRLFVARDRLGIKPLYWTDDGQRFAFASEIKALLPVLSRREIDPTALTHYLTFVAVPPPRTMFAGVNKLAPASVMLIERGGPLAPRRYWDAIGNRAQFDGDLVDWQGELRRRLERSIDRRMMSDVPVGVFLSGGVDSSTNVALMSRLVDHPINTFSIGFEGQEQFNEFDWARGVAADFATNHHEVKIDADELWRFLPDLVFHQDEPIADPVCVPLYFVAKLAKDSGVTVVHVGEGADEILAGYASYVQAWEKQTEPGLWRRFAGLPQPLRQLIYRGGAAALSTRPGYEANLETLSRGAQRGGQLWWGGAVAFYERAMRRVTTARLHEDAVGERPADVVAGITAQANAQGARSDLDRLIYQDLCLRLPELLLMRVDKLTMANAIEARVPFLDHEVVELAMAMPDSEKIQDGVGKHVLKRAVSDLLPADLVWRPKQGFGTPVAQWFRGELGEQLEQRLGASAVNELGYLDGERVGELLGQHRAGRVDRSFQLWSILNLSVWFDHWIAREEVAR
ncbi:MAG: asparagine synthase (glutamine-hydrolyzing) [Solirubrobacteraceae bacterium]